MKTILIWIFTCLTVLNLLSQTPQVLKGFPKNIDNKRGYDSYSVPLIADLNRDGNKEIIVITRSYHHSLGKWCGINVIQSNGESFPNFPIETDEFMIGIASGDINGDGYLDIVMRSDTRIHAIDRFANELPGFPVNFSDGDTSTFKTVSLYDLDNDGKPEIIAGEKNQLCVFNNLGQIKPGWPRFFTGTTNLTPAIGDLDNDGKGEIVILTYKHLEVYPTFDSAYVRIYRYNGENFSNNWPVKLDSNYGFWEGSPSIYINRQNSQESFILVPSLSNIANSSYYRSCITQYEINSNIRNRIYNDTYFYGYGTISIGDMNNDGALEFCGSAGHGSDTYLYANDLSLYPGWPGGGWGCFYYTPLIGKLTSGNVLNVILQENYQVPGQGGFLYGYNINGTQLPWSPMRPDGVVLDASMADINNDGSVELIALSFPRDTVSLLNIWTIPGVPYSNQNHPWPMYAHDRYRTNQYGFIPPDETVGIQNISSVIPSKFLLYQNYPNPFNPSTKIKFDITKSGFATLTIFDMTGREINKLINQNLTSGTYEYDFNAMNLPSGIYFYKLETGDFSSVKKMSLIK